MIAGEAIFRSLVRRFLRLPERMKPSEFIQSKIRLPAGFNEKRPGPVKLKRWMVEILDCLELRDVWDILLCGPTQEGKSFLLRMIVACKIGWRPGPMIWLSSTMNKGRSIVKKQIRPLIDHNPILSSRKPRDRHHYTNTEMLMLGAAINVFGANSENQVAGDTAEVVLGDEAAKWRLATEEEAAILELVRHRTEQYGATRKHFFSSTPRTENDLFWQEVERGDLRRWFIPCPHCGYMQALEWGDEQSVHGVKWSREAKRPDGSWDLEMVKTTARYHCANPECKGPPWDDEVRYKAIEDPRGEWRASKTARPGYRSYSLNGLYGTNESRQFGLLAAKFLDARSTGFLVDRQDFWNSDMGEVWRAKIEEVNIRKLAEIEVDYAWGGVPSWFKPDVVIMGADVQRSRLRYVVRALSWSGESYLVDFGWAPTWGDLDRVEADYRHLGAWRAIVDLNFEDRRQEVREQVYARSRRGWILADGVEYTAERAKIDRENVYLGGRGAGDKHYAARLVISTYDFKCELEARRAGTIKNWFIFKLDMLQLQDDHAVKSYAEYKKEMLDEQRLPRTKKQKGMPEDEFRSRTKANHAWDCEVYILAYFWALWSRRTAKQRRADRAAAGTRRTVEMVKTSG
jgi:phage terminase large subunit GpA-like protein